MMVDPDDHYAAICVGVKLGAPMFCSTFDSETNEGLVEGARLEIAQAREETKEEDGQPVTFLWIVARKPVAIQEG